MLDAAFKVQARELAIPGLASCNRATFFGRMTRLIISLFSLEWNGVTLRWFRKNVFFANFRRPAQDNLHILLTNFLNRALAQAPKAWTWLSSSPAQIPGCALDCTAAVLLQGRCNLGCHGLDKRGLDTGK